LCLTVKVVVAFLLDLKSMCTSIHTVKAFSPGDSVSGITGATVTPRHNWLDR
jgi:hypothetical protein